MAEHKYEFDIKMTCGGCSGAVERVLKKLDGVKSFQVDLPGQHAEVLVDGEQPSYEDIYTKIYKTGKTINSAKVDGEPRALPTPPA